jgi:hypothetical protein
MGDAYGATYAIDHTANTFVRKVYGQNISGSPADGATITDSGVLSTLSSGITSLSITYNLSPGGTTTTYSPPLTGSWAVEIPGQAALIGMVDYANFTPAVPSGTCPSIATAQTFQFVTIPDKLALNTTMPAASIWNPQLETAYGSVKISTSGTTVQFSDVSQSTILASGVKSGRPVNPGPSSATALCAPTFYGQTVGYPQTVTVINPGTTESVPPTATIGIGPTGFLVEDAGSSQVTGQPYENLLGAGYGAIGLPQPSSAVDTKSLAGARYEGFIYGTGGPVSTTTTGPGFSLIGSFGYANLKASCPTLPAPANGATLFGGEFANNDPDAHAYGNCDLAIDLGKQDASNNGLYPAATVYVASGFAKNGITKAYTFPAVAIAGQIDGQFAIFLIGLDTTGSPQQAWGIYLLQKS